MCRCSEEKICYQVKKEGNRSQQPPPFFAAGHHFLYIGTSMHKLLVNKKFVGMTSVPS